MLLYLQIAFTIVAALFIAAAIPVGAFWGWAWALACGFCALLFFGLMLLCKQTLAMKEPKEEENAAPKEENGEEKKP